MKTIHYVANLVIKRVEVEDGNHPGLSPANSPKAGRRVGDVISLVVRSGDLEALKDQLKNHLLVATDDINVPIDEEKVTR